MTAEGDLLQAVRDLETTLRQSADLPERDDNAHRKQGIELRRQIAKQILKVSETGELAFEASDVRGNFRAEFSKMRAAMAHHQASWPIVAIDRSDPSYHASVSALRDANTHFFAWVRSALHRA